MKLPSIVIEAYSTPLDERDASERLHAWLEHRLGRPVDPDELRSSAASLAAIARVLIAVAARRPATRPAGLPLEHGRGEA